MTPAPRSPAPAIAAPTARPDRTSETNRIPGFYRPEAYAPFFAPPRAPARRKAA